MNLSYLLYTSSTGSILSSTIPRLKSLLWMMTTALLLCSCDSATTIVNDLEERDANEIVVLLASQEIQAEKISKEASTGGKSTPTWNIAVPKSQRIEALNFLNMTGLPRRHGQNLLDLFEKQGLVSSEMEERIRYQSGLAAQIAGTIRKIDGVLDADVQISFPREEVLPGQNKDPGTITASVYVKHQGVLDNPNSHLVLKIKRLVASAIPGLDFEQVTVISDRGLFNDPSNLNLSAPAAWNSVWGIRVHAQDSTRLQALLLGFSCLALLLSLLIGWLLWKISGILSAVGGFASLVSLKTWQIAPATSSSEATPTTESTPPTVQGQ